MNLYALQRFNTALQTHTTNRSVFAQRFVRYDATGGTFLRRALRLNGDEMRSLTLALVFEHSEEYTPLYPCVFTGIVGELDQHLHVQVLDC